MKLHVLCGGIYLSYKVFYSVAPVFLPSCGVSNVLLALLFVFSHNGVISVPYSCHASSQNEGFVPAVPSTKNVLSFPSPELLRRAFTVINSQNSMNSL